MNNMDIISKYYIFLFFSNTHLNSLRNICKTLISCLFVLFFVTFDEYKLHYVLFDFDSRYEFL